MRWVWVNTDRDLCELLEQHAQCDDVAVDTEFRRRDTYFPQPALLQLCWSDIAYLVDPTAINDTSGLRDLLTCQRVIKYLHSASEDLEVFEHWLEILPQPLFDTQTAAGLVGLEASLSYRALAQSLLNVDVPKDETQSDWLQRPLSPAQLRYAAMDVLHLLPIGRHLKTQVELVSRLEWVLQEGARMLPGGRGPLAKFKSAWKLDRSQQQALAALVAWRENRARERNRPRGWILHDKVLLTIAQRRPASTKALADIDGLPQGLLRHQGDAILRVLSRPGEHEAKWQAIQPLDRATKGLLKRLTAERDLLSKSLSMAPESVAGTRELEGLLRDAQQGTSVSASSAFWAGWRADTVLQPLQNVAMQLIAGGE